MVIINYLLISNFITKGNPEELKIQYSAGYKLHIKFDDTAILENDSNSSSIDEAFNKVCNMINGFDMYKDTVNNQKYEPYLRGLINVLERIKDKTSNIAISLIGKDSSFELIISIIKERQKELFIEVLNMKNKDKTIAEMSIAMQSLENILTSLN